MASEVKRSLAQAAPWQGSSSIVRIAWLLCRYVFWCLMATQQPLRETMWRYAGTAYHWITSPQLEMTRIVGNGRHGILSSYLLCCRGNVSGGNSYFYLVLVYSLSERRNDSTLVMRVETVAETARVTIRVKSSE